MAMKAGLIFVVYPKSRKLSHEPPAARSRKRRRLSAMRCLRMKSGIHVDGLLKDRQCYQALDPAVLGRSHRMVLGKHSGLGAVMNALKELGFEVSPDDAKAVLAEIKAYAQRTKAGVSTDRLRGFYQAVSGDPTRAAHLLPLDGAALPH